MPLKDIDFDGIFRRLADRRIEEAMEEGKFDNLPGAGAPLELEPLPADENARMTWWAIRLLRQADVMPHEVKWRKAIDHLRHRLERATEEAEARRLVGQINELVHRLNTLGTNALQSGVAKLDLEAELAKVRERAGVRK